MYLVGFTRWQGRYNAHFVIPGSTVRDYRVKLHPTHQRCCAVFWSCLRSIIMSMKAACQRVMTLIFYWSVLLIFSSSGYYTPANSQSIIQTKPLPFYILITFQIGTSVLLRDPFVSNQPTIGWQNMFRGLGTMFLQVTLQAMTSDSNNILHKNDGAHCVHRF